MKLNELVSKTRTEIEDFSRSRAKAFVMNGKLCTRMLGGPIMYCDPTNNDFTPWLGLEGFWESWISMAIGRALQPGWICYDVGAAWGYYSLMFGWSGASHIVAIEPNVKRADFVAINMNTNYHTIKFDLCTTAVNDGKTDSVNIEVIPGRVCGFPSIKNMAFASKTFDEVCQDKTSGKADFIKVDIDGGELLFWDGVQKTIQDNPNLIMVMEVNANRYDAKDYYGRINSVYPTLRVVTTDGGTKPVAVDELIQLSMVEDQMVWLQK